MQDGQSDPRIMMPNSRKGNGKKALRRPVPLSIDFAKRLRNAIESKLADASVVRKANRRAVVEV
jgi:hypothetical protein